LQITPRNHEVTELACRKCHGELTATIDPAHTDMARGGLTCTKCHNDVGHIE
jgi:cytochrome c nitrite reductase small subunit